MIRNESGKTGKFEDNSFEIGRVCAGMTFLRIKADFLESFGVVLYTMNFSYKPASDT